MGMSTTPPDVRKDYRVRLVIRATGRNPDDALQHALFQVRRDGLDNAAPSVEEVADEQTALPAGPADQAVVADRLRNVEQVEHGSRGGFHGLFLG